MRSAASAAQRRFMRTPLRLLAPNAHTEDLINTVQTLYLLEKINKEDIARAAQEYMDMAYQNITTPGLLLLLRYGVYVQYVHPLSLAHLAQPDGAGYASRAWALMGYKPSAINNKVIRAPRSMEPNRRGTGRNHTAVRYIRKRRKRRAG